MVLKDRRFFGAPAEHRAPRAPAEHRAPRSPDAELEAQVACALADDGEVDASDVAVTASGDEITLSGTVTRTEEIGRCSRIALRVDGVGSVRNVIGVWGSKM